MLSRIQGLSNTFWNHSLAQNAWKGVSQMRFTSTELATVDTNTLKDKEEPDVLFKSIEVEVRSAEPAVLKSYEWFALTAAKHLGITVGKCWAPPKPHHNRLTLLKSVHIYKVHRVQYEIRTHFRHMTFERLTGSTADTFLEYIQRNLPEGVAMKVTKTSLERMPEPIKNIAKAQNLQ